MVSTMSSSTKMHEVAKCGTLTDLRALISAGYDVNAVDADGLTPLALAQAYARPEIADNLRRAGAF